MLPAALAIRFILELCLLSAVGWAVFHLVSGPAGFGLALKAVLALALLWGTFLSPKRRVELGAVPRLLIEAVLFVAAALLLLGIGHAWLAGALVGAELFDKAAVEWLRRDAA